MHRCDENSLEMQQVLVGTQAVDTAGMIQCRTTWRRDHFTIFQWNTRQICLNPPDISRLRGEVARDSAFAFLLLLLSLLLLLILNTSISIISMTMIIIVITVMATFAA